MPVKLSFYHFISQRNLHFNALLSHHQSFCDTLQPRIKFWSGTYLTGANGFEQRRYWCGHRIPTVDKTFVLRCMNVTALGGGTGEQSLLYRRNHTKCIFNLLLVDERRGCSASPCEEGRGFNGIASFTASKPPAMLSKLRKLFTFNITEPSEGQFSNTGKQVEINGNKVITSFKYSHFMRY